jgi:uncharacterized protein (TIGR02145 family)
MKAISFLLMLFVYTASLFSCKKEVDSKDKSGSISALKCAEATNEGSITAGVAVSQASSTIPYIGGNGGAYEAQAVNSSGVTGLTASLSAGAFKSGPGSLTYIITGTPSESGAAKFAFTVGGQSCEFSRIVAALPGNISTLNCGSASDIGALISGTTAVNVSSNISYLGGNGGAHDGQVVNSTGVTGLTATLSAGSFNAGSGSLTYTISGTPTISGTANFALNIGGQFCTLRRTVSAISGMLHACGADSVHNAALNYGTMSDQDGNSYKTIQIGTQRWMAENLKTTKYRNGDLIPNVESNNVWSTLNSGAYSIFKNNLSFDCPYGKLYNWYAVDDNRELCPTGWHVPTKTEWEVLMDYLGGEGMAGGKMASTGTLYWGSPNQAATNESGFSCLPGGLRFDVSGAFNFSGLIGYWWSSTESSANNAYGRGVTEGDAYFVTHNRPKRQGFSVRCLKD